MAGMTADQLRQMLGDRNVIAADVFGIARSISEICNAAPDSPLAREMVIRALENQDLFENTGGLLDALARQVGLFPYVNPEHLSLRDRLAYEAHRPLGSSKLVFHREQADVYRGLMDGESYVLSAPTSFGKSLVIDALIASGRYNTVVIIVPTIALIDETRRRLSRFKKRFKIITHPDQKRGNGPPTDSTIFVLTQERALGRNDLYDIDLLVIDEFYKLQAGSKDEQDRASALNHVLYRLHRVSKQIYLLGPNISDISEGFGERFDCHFKRTDFNTVVSQIHRVAQKPSREQAFVKLCQRLDEPTLIYCKSPKQANEIMRLLVDEDLGQSSEQLAAAAEWVGQTFHPQWTLRKALANGIGLHHGRIPRSMAQLMVALFNEGEIRFLVCTSSLIEGVNTSAKNVVIYESRIGRPKLDYFTFRNIQGRAGRMRRHFIGDVYIFDEEPTGEFDFVEVPVVTQGDDATLGLLVQIDDEDLKPDAEQRVAALKKQNVLSFATIRQNAHVDPEGQIALARELIRDQQRLNPLLSWRGARPSWESLQTACDLIFRHFVKSVRAGVGSGAQLAFRIRQLQEARSTSNYVRVILERDNKVETPDEAVEAAMEFQRNWAGFTFPRYLIALELIQKEVFGKRGLPVGDYSAYAVLVEHLFLPSEIPAMEEYGLPTEVGRKLQRHLRLGEGLDAALASLRRLPLPNVDLTDFEKELVERCRRDI